MVIECDETAQLVIQDELVVGPFEAGVAPDPAPVEPILDPPDPVALDRDAVARTHGVAFACRHEHQGIPLRPIGAGREAGEGAVRRLGR